MIAQSRLRRRVCRRVPPAPSHAPRGSGHRARGPSPCRGAGHVSGKHPGVEPRSQHLGSRARPGTCGGHAASICPFALDDVEDTSRTHSSAEKHQPAASPQPGPAPPGAAGALPGHQSTSAPCFSSETLRGHHRESPSPAAGCGRPFAPRQYLRVSATDQAPHRRPHEGQRGRCLPRGAGTALGSGGAAAEPPCLNAPPGALPRCPRGSHVAPGLAAGQSPGSRKRQGMDGGGGPLEEESRQQGWAPARETNPGAEGAESAPRHHSDHG